MTVDLNTMVDLLHARMSTMEATLGRVSEALVSIARIDERQQGSNEAMSRAFTELSKINERLARLEEQQPVSKLISGWVLAWVAGLVGLVGGAIAMKVLGL